MLQVWTLLRVKTDFDLFSFLNDQNHRNLSFELSLSFFREFLIDEYDRPILFL